MSLTPWANLPDAAAGQTTATETQAFAPGEILVGFEGEVAALHTTRGTAAALAAAGDLVGPKGLLGPKILFDLPAKDNRAARLATRWQLPAGADVLEVVNRLSGLPGVAYAEPNYVGSIASLPNDPKLNRVWGLHNTGQKGGTADADIDAPEAWDISTGSRSVVVGVIDSGVDYNHVDLAANMWTNPGETPGNGIDDDNNGFVDDVYGWDFANNDNDPFDDNGHGTHVAGTIGAVGNNGIGVAGVNWNVQIMALKWVDSNGSGTVADAAAAVSYATMMRTRANKPVNIRVTNNSWLSGSQTLYDAIQASGEADILFVAAAGNNGQPRAFYPAGYDLPNIISVAATDRDDALASFSNYSATMVDLGAPGVNVLSTTPRNRYQAWDGTSMAAPHVAGVAALAWSTAPDASYQTIRDAIFDGVDPLDSLNGKTVTGGRLNAFRTLQSLGPATISIDDVAVTEGDSGTVNAVFTVTLSKPSTEQITVDFASADHGSATAGVDYQSAAGTLTFSPGQTSQSIIVIVNGDTAEEGDETFLVNLANASANAAITDGQGVGTIVDDDGQGGTFDSVDVPKTIADPHPKKGPRPVSSELTVPSGGISIGSLGLQISLDHGSMTDLTATLTSPSNTTASLFYDSVQLQWNLVNPNAFNGELADGVWILTFTDTVRNRITGTLNNWSLTIAPPAGAPLAASTANSSELLAIAPNELNFSSNPTDDGDRVTHLRDEQFVDALDFMLAEVVRWKTGPRPAQRHESSK